MVLGTRPEAIKLAPVVRALRETGRLRVRVLATAQHRELSDRVLEWFDVRPDIDLDLMRDRDELAGLAARMLAALDTALVDERPDVVLGQGDTVTAFIAALAAFYRRVPFVHVEAGLRTGRIDAPFPEEGQRAAIARFTSLHCAPTGTARERLLAEGIAEGAILVTGNPVVDALDEVLRHVDVTRFRPGADRRLVLVTAHRRENHGEPLVAICEAVRRLVAVRGDVEVLWPVHPSPAVTPVVEAALGAVDRVRVVPALDHADFVAAMAASQLILTDSGGVQEEAPTLQKPVLVLRDVTERPEGIAAGFAELVGTDPERIVRRALARLGAPPPSGANPYGDGHAGTRIAAAVADRFGAAREA